MDNAAVDGVLYIVATPLGNLADITQRALDVLRDVDYVLAEDTRHSKILCAHYGINTRLQALHEHNEQARIESVLADLQQGKSLALISDAGTPLISDPGYHLTKALHVAGVRIVPVPGPCALIAALSAAGLPTDRFVFEGFLPVKSGKRRQRLSALQYECRTMVLYEAPHRIAVLLEELESVLGADRQVVLARELTKTFETIHCDNLAGLRSWVAADPNQRKGEMVLLVAGAEQSPAQKGLVPAEVLRVLLAELPLKQAVTLTARITGESRNPIYQLALSLTKEN